MNGGENAGVEEVFIFKEEDGEGKEENEIPAQKPKGPRSEREGWALEGKERVEVTK